MLDKAADRSHHTTNLPRRSLLWERTGEVCHTEGPVIRHAITKKAEEVLKQATPAVWSLVEDALSPLSEAEKGTLADLLGKVRAGLLPHFTRDTDINVSAGYETSDLPRLIKRLGNYAPSSTSQPKRQPAAMRDRRPRPPTKG